jgi:hypothetical protein
LVSNRHGWKSLLRRDRNGWVWQVMMINLRIWKAKERKLFQNQLYDCKVLQFPSPYKGLAIIGLRNLQIVLLIRMKYLCSHYDKLNPRNHLLYCDGNLNSLVLVLKG